MAEQQKPNDKRPEIRKLAQEQLELCASTRNGLRRMLPMNLKIYCSIKDDEDEDEW